MQQKQSQVPAFGWMVVHVFNNIIILKTMTNTEKIAVLEDMLELDNGTLSVETELSAVKEFDSMAKLSLIVVSDDEFGKRLTGEQIREFKTVGDIIIFWE